MPISLRHKSALTVGVVVLLAVTACAPAPLLPRPAPLGRAVASVRMPQVADPLTAYAQDPLVLVRVRHAVDVLSSRCMKRFGEFTIKPANYTQLAASFVEGASRLYGITDSAVAAQYGYLPVPIPLVADPPEETTAQFRLIYLGLRPGQNPAQVSQTESPGTARGQQIPVGGCLGSARKTITGQITGRPHGQANLGFELDVAAWVAAWSDSETMRAKSDWSSCLARHGYRMVDPLEGVPTRAEGPASQSEIQQALADISCKESTGFIRKANAVAVRFAQKALLNNKIALQPSKQFNDEALQNANSVLAGKL